MSTNKTITNTFMTETNNGRITKVHNSAIFQPQIQHSGKGIKWFDDSQLLKRNKYKQQNMIQGGSRHAPPVI